MPEVGILWVLALTGIVGVAAIIIAFVPGLKSSPHAPALIQMFSKSWFVSFTALIGLLVGGGVR